jgi:predicted permease
MPDWNGEVRARLSSLRLTAEREAEIVEELSQHLDDRWQELMAGGASAEQAARTALADFQSGNVLAQYMAPLRQARSPEPVTMGAATGHVLTDVWQDLRYAARVFARKPAFTAAAVVTLALGVGACTAIFSVVYGVMLKPLSFPEPDRLVHLLHYAVGGDARNQGPDTYLTYHEHQRAFEAIGGWDRDEVSITGRGEPERVASLAVTSTLLPLLRVQPALGRLFTREDDIPNGPLRVILTHGYWQRRFGAATDIIGQSLMIDGRPAEIIGVLPVSFRFPRSNPAVLVPMPLERDNGISFGFQALGRLKPGVTLAQASDDVARMIPLLHPSFKVLQMRPYLRPLSAYVVGSVGKILWILFAAVGLVLLIACGNVANLFLVRAESRQQELAVRAALGASRARIAQVLFCESALLALLAGLLGVLLAQAGLGLLRRMAPAQLPRVDELGIDPIVLLFALGVSLLSGVLFAAIAVLKFGRPSLMAFKEGGRTSSDGPTRHRTRNTLVVAQVALALTLMIVSGLMIRTVMAMRQVPPGFQRADEVQTFRLTIPEEIVPDRVEMARAHQTIAERLAQVPGVTSVGLASSITMDGENNLNPLFIEDAPVPDGQLVPHLRFKTVAPGYLETMGNRLLAGRTITWADSYEGRLVVVITETLAREYWQEPARAIGRRVRCCNTENPWREIVGVIGAERDDGLNLPATAIVYWPMLNESYSTRGMAYAIRSNRVGTPGFLSELQKAVWSLNPSLPLADVRTLDEIRDDSMAQTSFVMVMLGIAAGVALLLGMVGIYAVIACVASQRTREVGIRIALGAQIGNVHLLFVRHGLWLTLTGIAIGIAMALALTRVMSALLFGVGPMDPLTYAGVSITLAGVALLAVYLPARKAARVDPIIAMRADQ